MARWTSASALLVAVIAAAGISACGSSSGSPAGSGGANAATTSTAPASTSSSTSQASTTAKTSSDTAASAKSDPPALTKPGKTLKVGQTGTVQFGTTLKNGDEGPTYTFAITVQSIAPGSMSDFKVATLTGVPKGATPTYVKLTITNVGARALRTSVGDPAYSMGAVEPDGLDGDLSMTGDFPPCPQADSPGRYVPGQSFHTCQIYMERGKVTQVGYDGSESTVDTPVTWALR